MGDGAIMTIEAIEKPEVKEAIPVEPPTVINAEYISCEKCHKITDTIKHFSDDSIQIIQNGKTLIKGLKVGTGCNIIVTCPAGHQINALTGKLNRPKPQVEENKETENEK